MPATPTAAHETPPTQESLPGLADHAPESRDSHTRSRRQPPRPAHPPTDDEILGLDTAPPRSPDPVQAAFDFDATSADAQSAPASESAAAAPSGAPDPANFRGIFEANPELRQAWQDAQAYRETFATPEAARAATAQLADLDRMDALFFSRNPEDHAELARVVATLDPQAFASLAQAITALAPAPPPGEHALQHDTHPPPATGNARNIARVFRPEDFRPSSVATPPANNSGRMPGDNTWRDAASSAPPDRPVIPNPAAPFADGGEGSAFLSRNATQQQIPRTPSRAPENQENNDTARDFARNDNVAHAPTAAQAEFFHAANAAAVEGVLEAIESQVERLLPEGVSKSARNRVVGEIYRELDSTLRSNRQLGQQMRDAFRSGSLDTDHQRAIVSLVTGRARQALPAVAKRVLNEWTSTVVAANNDRRARQHAAERRIDISGASGAASSGRSASPRSVDYARMSDSDILNL
jgi:hypothetical protein